MLKIVIFDGHTVNPGDVSWEALEALGSLTVFDKTDPEQMLSRMGETEVLLTSKCVIDRKFMEQCPCLRYIGVTATGYNNVDVTSAKELGIAVTNIPAYSTEAVAQHTIALILALCNHVMLHNDSVQRGEWQQSDYFSYWKAPVQLLLGKSLGIIGYGQIGRRVGEIAQALGMKVNIYSRNPEETMKSDFVSLHCPMTTENQGFVDSEFFNQMKPGAVLINTARGGLVDERALADVLRSGYLRAAALDVLAQEPPQENHPLIGLSNCIITPHIAWSPVEMRKIICCTLADNLKSFLEGGRLNRVDL